jgi:hypothetical protein
MSFKPEVIADSSGNWYDNALRFATLAEAEASARDLMSRWMLVRDCRAVESTDPVNYRWDPAVGLCRVELQHDGKDA